MEKTNTKVSVVLNMDRIMTTVQQLHNYLPFSSQELKTMQCYFASSPLQSNSVSAQRF